MYFAIHLSGTTSKRLIKIGQYPSIADISVGELVKYKSVLGNEYADFKKGIGLFSHGIGIGSFIYLRRILETLIEEAHQRAKANQNEWDEDIYVKSRVSERIDLLSHFLPPTLVGNANIYSVLSKGIHELTEEECLGIFPLMKTFTELILDEKIAARQREEKTKLAATQLGEVVGKLKK